MIRLRKSFLFLALLAGLVWPASARADIVVAFYSHDFGSSFPHAFITIAGTLQRDGTPVDANVGFTAQTISPAILMGSVPGKIEKVDPKYVASSDRQFIVHISDAQYDTLQALIAKWRALPGKSYSMNHHNCVHFAGEAAQILGLKVVFDKNLMKKPRSFLLNVIALNPWVKGK